MSQIPSPPTGEAVAPQFVFDTGSEQLDEVVRLIVFSPDEVSSVDAYSADFYSSTGTVNGREVTAQASFEQGSRKLTSLVLVSRPLGIDAPNVGVEWSMIDLVQIDFSTFADGEYTELEEPLVRSKLREDREGVVQTWNMQKGSDFMGMVRGVDSAIAVADVVFDLADSFMELPSN